MNWSPKRTLISGLTLIVGVNLVALAGVFYNRSGAAESVLKLSERELTHVGWRDNKEDTSLSLNIAWRVLPPEPQITDGKASNNYWLYGWYQGEAEWLNDAKMTSLGFTHERVQNLAERRSNFGRQLPHDVLLVLENDGAAYQTALSRVTKYNRGNKEDLKMLEDERNTNSRLFVIDAGLDIAALRATYPDPRRYAIVRGQIRPSWQQANGTPPKLTGFVSKMHIDGLNVPLELRGVFEGGAGDAYESASRPAKAAVPTNTNRRHYEVDVSFGQRLEPWITSATQK